MQVFQTADDLRARTGERLGTSRWFTIEQAHIDRFADATDDHQWIHIDPERAAGGPFGTTIAHGFLSLSLLAPLVSDVYRLEGVGLSVNYGLNRVRFTSPVPAGSNVRAVVDLVDAEQAKDGSLQVTTSVTVDRQGDSRPALIAELLTRHYS